MKRLALAVVFVLTACLPSQAAWSHLQTTATDSAAAVNATAYGSGLSANSLLVVAIVWDAGSAFTSIADSKGNTYVQVQAEQFNNHGSFPFRGRLYYALNPGSGADTVTATVSGSPAFHQIYISEYSGLATSTPLDASNAGVQSAVYSLSASSGAVNELLYGFAQGATTASVTNPPFGWNVRSTFDGRVFDQVSASGSNAMTLGAGQDGDVGLFLAIFSLAGGGGGTPCVQRLGTLGVTSCGNH